jgi:AcrR family transcriptional regulator
MVTVKPELGDGGSRRERARVATRGEIVQAARELLVAGGLDGVTLRAIAARLGMTAPALYRYFDSREALLGELIDALYDELADELIAVRDAVPAARLSERFMVTSFRFRAWALEHRAEFGLLFGAPLPGVLDRPPPDPGAHGRGERFATVWLELFVAHSRQNPAAMPRAQQIPARLRAPLNAYRKSLGNVVPSGALMLYLSSWMQLYGAVTTEVFGHLDFVFGDTGDAEELFRDVLATICHRIGLPLTDDAA